MSRFIEAHFCPSCRVLEAECPCCGARMREVSGDWDPSKHPRADAGSPNGGQFISGGGEGGGGSSEKKSASKIDEKDKSDMRQLLKAFHEELGASHMSDAADIKKISGLSTQRIKALVNKYDHLHWKILGGRRLEWIDSSSGSHAKSSPGITGHAIGTSGYQPAAIAAVRYAKKK